MENKPSVTITFSINIPGDLLLTLLDRVSSYDDKSSERNDKGSDKTTASLSSLGATAAKIVQEVANDPSIKEGMAEECKRAAEKLMGDQAIRDLKGVLKAMGIDIQ
jgi:hypothetical protein